MTIFPIKRAGKDALASGLLLTINHQACYFEIQNRYLCQCGYNIFFSINLNIVDFSFNLFSDFFNCFIHVSSGIMWSALLALHLNTNIDATPGDDRAIISPPNFSTIFAINCRLESIHPPSSTYWAYMWMELCILALFLAKYLITESKAASLSSLLLLWRIAACIDFGDKKVALQIYMISHISCMQISINPCHSHSYLFRLGILPFFHKTQR